MFFPERAGALAAEFSRRAGFPRPLIFSLAKGGTGTKMPGGGLPLGMIPRKFCDILACQL